MVKTVGNGFVRLTQALISVESTVALSKGMLKIYFIL
jgi:hypothetical protein